MRRFRLLIAGLLVLAIAAAGCTSRTAAPTEPEPQTQTPDDPKDGAVQVPEDNRPTILAIGDSITGGPTVEDSETYPAQLERLLNEQGYAYKVINAGMDRMDSRRVFTHLPGLLERKPFLMILGLGYVDRYEDAETKKNLAEIIKRFQDGGAKVVLAGEGTRPKLYEELAAEFQIPLVPDLRRGLKENEGLETDGVHCNPKGCLHIAEQNVLPVILPLLSKVDQK